MIVQTNFLRMRKPTHCLFGFHFCGLHPFMSSRNLALWSLPKSILSQPRMWVQTFRKPMDIASLTFIIAGWGLVLHSSLANPYWAIWTLTVLQLQLEFFLWAYSLDGAYRSKRDHSRYPSTVGFFWLQTHRPWTVGFIRGRGDFCPLMPC